MSGGSKQQTTTTNNAPWGAAQPALKLGLDQAQKLFKADPTGKNSVYTGSTVVPWAQQTQTAMGNLTNAANANAGGQGLSGQYQNVINSGGMTPMMRQAADRYTGIAGSNGLSWGQNAAQDSLYNVAKKGGWNEATGDAAKYQEAMMNGTGMSTMQSDALKDARSIMGAGGYNADMRDALGGYNNLQANPFNSYQNNALKNTQQTANSSFDPDANPAFQQVLQQAQNAARDSVNMSAGGSGRYGGGVHQGNLASEVGDLTARAVGQEYNNWQGRRDTANQNMFGMGQTGVNTQMGANAAIAGLGQTAMGNRMAAGDTVSNIGQTALTNRANAANNLGALGQGAQNMHQSALSNIANIGQSGMTNRMNANSALSGLGQQAFGNMGAAYTGMQAPNQDLMQVGAMTEDLATRQMNDKLRVFNEQQNAPWQQLGRLNAIAGGAGTMGGTQTQSAPGQNPFLQAMGYATGGAGLLGSFL